MRAPYLVSVVKRLSSVSAFPATRVSPFRRAHFIFDRQESNRGATVQFYASHVVAGQERNVSFGVLEEDYGVSGRIIEQAPSLVQEFLKVLFVARVLVD